jgi:hypothetical protein
MWGGQPVLAAYHALILAPTNERQALERVLRESLKGEARSGDHSIPAARRRLPVRAGVGGSAAPLPLFTLPGKPILIALYAL